jgi:hypothetical protein
MMLLLPRPARIATAGRIPGRKIAVCEDAHEEKIG